ncbi:hypothetical protein ACL02S_19520 [Nocardia sp. 004]|uniref:hypothetical protein n=1 Tax=Nocardia sp. 004 TaxID=3385978 RepID=UPI0039A1B158
MTETFPAPSTLWARIAVWEALEFAEGDVSAKDFADGRITFDDGGGNWATLVRYPDDRAVLFGWDRNSENFIAEEFYDPLAQAPHWVPIAELNPLVIQYAVSFVYWWDAAAWHHTPTTVYDGAGSCLGSLCDIDHFVNGYTDFAFDIADCDDEETGDAAMDTIRDLCSAAERGSVHRELLDALHFVAPSALDEVYAYLRDASVTRGSARPVEPYPAPPTGPRTRRKFNEFEHDRLLVEAMRAATELPREQPPSTPQLARVLEQIAEQTVGYGPIDVSFRVADGVISSQGGHPLERLDLWELRTAENAEHGRWLFIRFRTEADRIIVDRAYDHWPSWHPLDPYRSDPHRRDIVGELAARPERWRPALASIAADEFAYTDQ